ncbi:DUF2268 domain-containing putative Zn-dependent protease [Flagellimonas allohymeniacidonis]|uniref:Uncharacterized protein n=1 Tax=Flagellimonas allohymeniacidonis TaxID=2517819 RepID=A0A4Q8QI49_9FLAO|nr:DUF2268 domain-containing putative Zn-dependent protease [Allomuricauda hymeniacidonis]TAI48353.1 hypothetical protein EW142_00655 [Allomuricauda hymeniacidonis]
MIHLKNRKSIFYIAILLVLFTASCKKDVKPNHTSKNRVDFDKAFEAYETAKEHLKKKDTLGAINNFVKAAEYGFEPRQAFSEAIYHSMQLNLLDGAMNLSFRIVDKGFRDFSQMQTPPFNGLAEHADWEKLKTAIRKNEKHYRDTHGNIDDIKIVTSDIDNFWRAYDLAKVKDSLGEKREIYLKEYFIKGSKGLQDFTFLKMRQGGIDQFTEFVETHRPYYDGIREANKKALNTLSSYPNHLKKVQQLIPKATFADTYFLMGCHTSFGTVSMNGSLIGLENVVDENTPVHTLPDYRQSITKGVDFLSFVLIHELMHTYQNTSHRSLLGATIMEGGADFLTELVLGPPNVELDYRIYGEKYEREIWEEFKQNLEITNHKNWIAGVDAKKKAIGWPSDLSYFIGYKIAKGYYQNTIDKERAIVDLLEIKDPYQILKVSGYGHFEQ